MARPWIWRDDGRTGRHWLWQLAGLLLAGAGLAALAVALALADHAAEVRRAKVRVASHVTAIAEHVGAVHRGADLILERIALTLEGRDLSEARGDLALHQFLRDLKGRLPDVASVFVVGADGRTVASSRAFPVPPYDVRGRDYFLAARDGPGGLHVSSPLRDLITSNPGFVISLPIRRAGQFAGLAAVTVFPLELTATYRDMLGEAEMLLARADGVVLVRTDGARAVERLPGQAEIMERAAGREDGLFVGPSIIDGERALNGVRRLPGLDLLVAVVLNEGDILRGWERRTAMIGGGAALAFAGLAAWAFSVPARGAWWRLFPRRPGGRPDLPQALPAGGAALLDLLASRVRARLAIGDAAGADAAARLIGALLGLARDDPPAPGPVDAEGLVPHVRDVLSGAGLPDITQAPAVGARPLVQADAGRLELAVIDLVMGLSALAPGARSLAATVTAGAKDGREATGLPAGDYVRLRLEVVEGQMVEGQERERGARAAGPAAFMLARAVAQGCGGACVVPAPAAGHLPLAELWLPQAQAPAPAPAAG